MSRKIGQKKLIAEGKFIAELLETGIKLMYEMDEANSTYYCFEMKEGRQRFWKNLSPEGKARIKEAMKKEQEEKNDN